MSEKYQNLVLGCQNCKNDFIIEPDDFSFYAKIKVPPPTFCPQCRRQRRFAFRNTHSLYKRKDSFSDKDIISIYSPDKNLVVIDQNTWWGDSWDPMDFSVNYDFSKNFFSQWANLRNKIPLQSLSNSKSVNSDYCNVAEQNKDCYLITACYQNERLYYSDSVYNNKDCIDLHVVYRTEFSYDDLNCSDSYKLFYSENSHSCMESYFLYDCKNCNHCFMSSNLRNKSYVFRNQQLSKEEYLNKIKEINFGSYITITKLKKEMSDMKIKIIHRYAQIVNSINTIGDYVENAKNVKFGFYLSDNTENCKFMYWGGLKAKDCFDTDACAVLEQSYEIFDVGVGSNKCFFGSVIYSCNEVEYSFNCYNSSNLFGCIGLRNKQYCILNKQYTKEEYFEMVEKIKKQMEDIPYIDKKGNIYKYGEFFPIELSPFAYNETVSFDIFPLNKESTLQNGFMWLDNIKREINIDLLQENIIDDIRFVQNDIVSKVIECAHKGECNHKCKKAFKILENELIFYKNLNIPIPRLCYACRHYERFNKRKPLELWHRKCMKEGCNNEFETSYSPDRPEIIYCEKCYQAEVY